MNNKKERKDFDDMWDIPRSYLPACSNAVSLVPLQPIFISILFHHYKELMELKAQVEQIIGDNNNTESESRDVAPTAPTTTTTTTNNNNNNNNNNN
ncbi:MAG: hypothetical protein M3247_08060, partial [Thermoproteota archaeon]|nr:hypothetical protein [Thermoproteota archaeon]